MKTQTYGVSNTKVAHTPHREHSSVNNPYSVQPESSRLRTGVRLNTIKSWYGGSYSETSIDGFLVACRQAVQNYKTMRENGDPEDNPSEVFPNDGRYKWETPYEAYSKIIYIEGTQDADWMAKKDAHYLQRTSKIGHVSTTGASSSSSSSSSYISVNNNSMSAQLPTTQASASSSSIAAAIVSSNNLWVQSSNPILNSFSTSSVSTITKKTINENKNQTHGCCIIQ